MKVLADSKAISAISPARLSDKGGRQPDRSSAHFAYASLLLPALTSRPARRSIWGESKEAERDLSSTAELALQR